MHTSLRSRCWSVVLVYSFQFQHVLARLGGWQSWEGVGSAHSCRLLRWHFPHQVLGHHCPSRAMPAWKYQISKQSILLKLSTIKMRSCMDIATFVIRKRQHYIQCDVYCVQTVLLCCDSSVKICFQYDFSDYIRSFCVCVCEIGDHNVYFYESTLYYHAHGVLAK